MKLKDFMLGDWIHIIDKAFEFNAKVSVIDEESVCVDGVQYPYYNNETNPIPLTEEILKANGFITNDDRTLNGCCIYHRLCGKYDEYKVTIKLLNGFITIESFDDRWYTLLNLNIRLRFVHELQNILRLCKLNELADNFKLKGE